MKPLNEHIRKNGFDYFKVKELAKKAYIYRQEDNGKVISFEVFRHKENTQFDCVSFPGNEAFGQWAWTYRNLPDAEKKFETLK